MKYCQTKGKRPTNWFRRIDEAEARGFTTDSDRRDAGEWITCMCGNQDDEIARDVWGEPIDHELKMLGIEFAVAIYTNNFDAARIIGYAINDRAAELLREMKVQK